MMFCFPLPSTLCEAGEGFGIDEKCTGFIFLFASELSVVKSPPHPRWRGLGRAMSRSSPRCRRCFGGGCCRGDVLGGSLSLCHQPGQASGESNSSLPQTAFGLMK